MQQNSMNERGKRIICKTMVTDLLKRVKSHMRKLWKGETRGQQCRKAIEMFNAIDAGGYTKQQQQQLLHNLALSTEYSG